jgi:hypothetical protein
MALSDVLPFGRPWYGEPDAISNAMLKLLRKIGQFALLALRWCTLAPLLLLE